MSRRTPLVLATCLLVLPAVSVCAGSSLPQLFQKTKQEFRFASYTEALGTLEEMARLSGESENERYRTHLLPALAFYRGACLAALGRTDEARSEFEIYLTFQPDAALDPALYPKKIVTAFEQARGGLRQKANTPAEGSAIAMSYRAFRHSPSDSDPILGEDWASSPARYLMTSNERLRFSRLSDPVSRSEFVTEFWKARDPQPETPENEFRDEFERRVAFADAHFSQDEVRGSLTDRGMVFVLLGPATWVGRKPIITGEDSTDPKGMFHFTRNDVVSAQAGLDPRVSGPMVDRMTGPNNSLPDAGMNWREVWHYRRELLPKGVPYQQVDFEFITRKGYGKNVLQRDDLGLTTLAAARSSSEPGAAQSAAR